MVETHIHALPDLDDGAADIGQSLDMIRFAYEDGVRQMIMTPHFRKNRYENDRTHQRFEELMEVIQLHPMRRMQFYLGNEIYLNEDSVEAVLSGKALPMAGSNYLLIEFPHSNWYPIHMALLFQLQLAGYKIIIAHAERYPYLLKDEAKLEQLLQNGCWIQITATFLTNFRTKRRALQWIRNGYVHLVASDGHDLDRRKPAMRKAFLIVQRYFGEEKAWELFRHNGERILGLG